MLFEACMHRLGLYGDGNEHERRPPHGGGGASSRGQRLRIFAP